MLPAFRSTNRSPGSVCVIRFGSIRESEQVINSVSGLCPRARRSNSCSLIAKDVALKVVNAGDELVDGHGVVSVEKGRNAASDPESTLACRQNQDTPDSRSTSSSSTHRVSGRTGLPAHGECVVTFPS